MYILRELLRIQNLFGTGNQDSCGASEGDECDSNRSDRKKCPPRKSVYTPSLAKLSMGERPKGSSQTIANPVLAAADPLLAFMNFQQTKEAQLAAELNKPNPHPWHAYVGPTGGFGKINNKHCQLGANFRSVGGLAGFDYAFSQVGLGMMVDYENIKADVHKHEGNFIANQFHVHAYTTYVPKSFSQFAINGILGAGGAWYDVRRNIAEPSEKISAKAKTRGAEVDALIGAQYLFAHKQFDAMPCSLEVIPFFNLQYMYEGIGSYKEHGAGLSDLKFYKQGFQSLRSTVGTWLQYSSHWKNFSIIYLIDMAWQREYLDRNHKLYTKPIEVEGSKSRRTIFGSNRDTALAGLDLMFEFYERYGIEMSYDFEFNNNYHNNAFFLGFNARF
jgi:outer membrane autotransporter protein